MPYIVIIADEMADLMMTAAKEVEQHIVRLAQKARAVGHAPDPGDPEADGRRRHRARSRATCPRGSPSRSPAGATRASCSTRWAPTGCWATATCSS